MQKWDKVIKVKRGVKIKVKKADIYGLKKERKKEKSVYIDKPRKRKNLI